jgi:hypothetical protein
MKIIDTNGVSHILGRRLALRHDYYLVPDVVEEVEMTQLVHGRRIPARVLELRELDEFDEVLYLDHYKNTLNSYGDRSFYNMRGFGDVSIIAAIHMLRAVFAKQQVEQLFKTEQEITVFTNDANLTVEIDVIFAGQNVTVLPITHIS